MNVATGDGARVVLVHGAWHRGESWEPVRAGLAAGGVDAVAPDLPSDVPGAGHDAAVAAVLTAAGAAGPVVLAGHSLGGLVATAAAARLGPRRVRALVLVGALVPEPATRYRDRLRADPGLMVTGYDHGVRRGAGLVTYWPDDGSARTGLYRGVADELAAGGHPDPQGAVRAAVAAMRPQDWTVITEPSPIGAWPAVRTVSVVCTGDLVVDPGAGRREAARVGAELVELDGGHFPMLTRPGQTAALLAGVAAGPATGAPR